MPALYRNTGAPRRFGGTRPVYRAGEWTEDVEARRGDVYPATPIEVLRFAHKLEPVEAKAYPAVPGESGPGEVEAADPSGGATTAADDAEPGTSPDLPDEIDIELYRHGDTSYYDLPNGDRVNGRDNALRALGLDPAEYDAAEEADDG